MIACESCKRPLLRGTEPCPFCSKPRATGTWLKVVGAVLTPFVLSACYGAPGIIFVDDCTEWDDDGDGFAVGNCWVDDCDDSDPTVFPGAEEQCDGVDNNCDGFVDEGECSDTGSDPDSGQQTGDIAIELRFDTPQASCESAGVTHVEVFLDGPETIPPSRFACDGERLRATFLTPGEWTVDASAISADGARRWVSSSVNAVVLSGRTTSPTLQMSCESVEPGACSE